MSSGRARSLCDTGPRELRPDSPTDAGSSRAAAPAEPEALLEIGHVLSDLAGARLRLLDRADAVEDGVAARAVEVGEGRCRGWRRVERGLEVVGHGGVRLAGVGGIPSTVGLRRVDLTPAGRAHPLRVDEARRPLGVDLRPGAALDAAGEPLPEVRVVVPRLLPVDPPEAQRFVDRVAVGDGVDTAALLGDQQPHTGRRVVVGLEPRAPRGGGPARQEVVLLRHDPSFADALGVPDGSGLGCGCLTFTRCEAPLMVTSC